MIAESGDCTGARTGGRRCRDRANPDWAARLPAAWREMVCVPLRFVAHREYEMTASRCMGYDEDAQLCYYAHHYLIEVSRSDDDEEFYTDVSGGESVHAWRLRDERWLIHRQPIAGDCQAASRGFYTFSTEPPR